MKLMEIAGKRMRPSHADYSRTYPVFFREGVPEMVVPFDAADAWKVEENNRAAWHSNIVNFNKINNSEVSLLRRG